MILDKDKFKLPEISPNKLQRNRGAVADAETKLKNGEALISERMNEIDELYNKTLKEAKEEADMIISQAYEQSKEIMDKAKKDGFLKGQSEGFEEGRKQAESIIQEALIIKRKIQAEAKKMVADFEGEVMALVIATIEKILRKKVDDEADIIQSLICSGLEKCAYTEDLVLRVSPDDYEFSMSIKDKILVLSQNVNDIIIKQDKSLAKGSCIIDSSSGSIDSGIWTQFNNVKEMYEELLGIE